MSQEDKDLEYRLVERLEQGQSLPNDLRQAVENHPDLRAYYLRMRALMQAFEQTSAPQPPETLVDGVMQYIEHCQARRPASAEPAQPSLAAEIWQSLVEVLACYRIPPVLKREAWPTALAALLIIWNAFIVPQVEAGKINELLQNSWLAEMERQSERLQVQSRQTVQRVTQLAEIWLGNSKEDLDLTYSEKRLEKTRRYLEK